MLKFQSDWMTRTEVSFKRC